jgi:hypothetical protein
LGSLGISGRRLTLIGGTSMRRCVTPPPDDSLVGGALRSGDIVVRTRFTGPWGFKSGHGQKVLWLPLHTASTSEYPLLIRAARLGNPSDSLRKTITWVAHSHGTYGYPSSVEFPAAGEWIVVTTAGSDWGCFLISVAD